jgi:hypothetical protein
LDNLWFLFLCVIDRFSSLPLQIELSRLNGGQPPLLFDATIDHLLSVAPESEGVFRLSGSQSEVDQVLEDFVFGRNPVLANRSVHVVCGVLKQWLRELPNPLLTYELHDAFCLAVQKRTHDEVMSALQKCLLKVKKENKKKSCYFSDKKV